MGMKPPVAVMFDWCNTIVKTDGLDFGILRKVMASIGCDDVDISGIPRDKIENHLVHALGNRWQEVVRLYSDMANSDKKKLHPLPNDNVHELLEFLHQNNIDMAIVSNKHGHSLRNEVCSLGLSRYFSAVLGSGDTSENKPSPEPIFAALEIMGVTPSKRVFFVGDSTADVESARRAKCCPIAYDNPSIEGVLSFSNFKDFGNFVAGLLG